MKIWQGYGSEHSANLVMIGTFRTAGAAAEAREAIEKFAEQVREEERAGLIDTRGGMDRYSDRLSDIMREVKVYDVGPAEIVQFMYDFRLKLDGTKLVLTTDESDVSALLKVMLDKGARVEVYSAHEYPDLGYGR